MTTSSTSNPRNTTQPVYDTPQYRAVLGLCLCVASALGNTFAVDLFFGVNFLFGSIFVWLALATVGPCWALVVALVGALPTVQLWGHWYAVLLFTLEPLFVILFCRATSTSRLAFSVLLYWVFVGGPLSLLIYSQILDLPSSTASLVVSKQGLNGLINSMIAGAAIIGSLLFKPGIFPRRRIAKTSSYSDVLQTLFGLAFLVPLFLSEFYELKRDFERDIISHLAETRSSVHRSALSVSAFLRLETAFWGTTIASLDPDNFEKEIPLLVAADTSAAPSRIFRVNKDRQVSEIFGAGIYEAKGIEFEGDLPVNASQPSAFFVGCQDNQFMSIFLDGTTEDAWIFLWAPQSVSSIAWAPAGIAAEIKCTPNIPPKLQVATDGTEVSVIRSTNPQITTLRSWLGAQVKSTAVLYGLRPASLEIVHSLKAKTQQVQSGTVSAIQRLCFLATLVVLGGQLLDLLFRRWVEKFVHVSELFLKGHVPSKGMINKNFKEDQEIAKWLNRFANAVETEEKRKFLAERNLQMLISEASTPVFATDSDDRITVWNPALTELTGYAKSMVIGKPISEFTNFPSGNASSTDEHMVSNVLLDMKTKGGKSLHLVVSRLHIDSEKNDLGIAFPTPENGSPTKFFIAQNLSELRAAQARMIHASRMSALGEMASSFAHELNQPLNIISLTSGNLLERARHAEVPQEYLITKAKRIESQALRAGKVIQGIRKFVLESGEEDVTVFDPVKRTISAIDLISEQLRLDSITVSISGQTSDVTILGQPILFEQTMLNLAVNAQQAMKRQANLDRKLDITFQLEESTLKILVRDNGPGIPAENLDRIFDPFFSTKKDDGGTGVGLYMCRTVVEVMHGKIAARDNVSGACIEIQLPVCESGGASS